MTLMPRRLKALVTGEIYHVYNRGIDKRTTFSSPNEFDRAREALWFYSWEFQFPSLSHYLKCSVKQKQRFRDSVASFPKRADILAYCFMGNHFHLLAKQTRSNGISKYLGDFQNSYTKFYNLVHDRQGPLFMPRFQAVSVHTGEQLIHISRYIHLNPYSGHLVDSLKKLANYPWSSFPQYQSPNNGNFPLNPEDVTSYFKTPQAYAAFVLNHADYQRQISNIKHLMIDN